MERIWDIYIKLAALVRHRSAGDAVQWGSDQGWFATHLSLRASQQKTTVRTQSSCVHT